MVIHGLDANVIHGVDVNADHGVDVECQPGCTGRIQNMNTARTTVAKKLESVKQRDARLKQAGEKVVSGLREAARSSRANGRKVS